MAVYVMLVASPVRLPRLWLDHMTWNVVAISGTHLDSQPKPGLNCVIAFYAFFADKPPLLTLTCQSTLYVD